MKIFRLHPSGQIIIFHQPRFPWNCRGFPLLNHHSQGIGTRVRSRWNLTRSFENCSLPTAAQQLHNIHNGVLAGRNYSSFNQLSMPQQNDPRFWSNGNGWFIRENPIRMDDFGGTTIFGNTHMIQRGSVNPWMNLPMNFSSPEKKNTP